jgi:hypothetical protein
LLDEARGDDASELRFVSGSQRVGAGIFGTTGSGTLLRAVFNGFITVCIDFLK